MSFNPIVFMAFLFSSGLIVRMYFYIRRTGMVLAWSIFALVFILISIILFPRALGYELVSVQEEWFSVVTLIPLIWIYATLVLANANDDRVLKEEHAKSLFHLDILTHDIANLSTPVIPYIDLLADSESIGEREKEVLDRVRSNLERMATLVTRVRHLASKELHDLNKQVVVDLNSTLERSIALLRNISSKKTEVEIVNQTGEKVTTGALIDEILISVFMDIMEDIKKEDSRIYVSTSRRTEGGSDFMDIDVSGSDQCAPDTAKVGRVGPKKSTPLRRYSKGIGLSISECERLLAMHGGSIELKKQQIGVNVYRKHVKIALRCASRTQ